MNIKKIGITALAGSALVLGACSNESANENQLVEDSPEITLASGPWETEAASTNVIATVLEDAGYDVEITTLDAAVIWEAMVSGDADAQVGAWMPQTSAPFVEEYGDDLEFLGANLEGAALGLAVPTYMEDVNSIEDLTDEAGQTITGIEAGAQVVAGAQDATEMYPNLEGWEVATSSSGAMATELGNAYEDQEEIVVTGWSPHWKFQAYDLKYLEDPQGAFGDEEYIETVATPELQDEEPIAHSILDNFYWEVADMETVMLAVQEGDSVENAARDWVDNNQEKVAEWTAEAEEMAGASQESESSAS